MTAISSVLLDFTVRVWGMWSGPKICPGNGLRSRLTRCRVYKAGFTSKNPFGIRRRAQPFSCRRFENLAAFSCSRSDDLSHVGDFSFFVGEICDGLLSVRSPGNPQTGSVTDPKDHGPVFCGNMLGKMPLPSGCFNCFAVSAFSNPTGPRTWRMRRMKFFESDRNRK